MNNNSNTYNNPYIQVIYTMNADRGWSCSELARRAGISPSTVNNLNGRAGGLKIETLDKICCAYEIRMSVFLKMVEDVRVTDNK